MLQIAGDTALIFHKSNLEKYSFYAVLKWNLGINHLSTKLLKNDSNPSLFVTQDFQSTDFNNSDVT